jgi:hypothetical protein
MFAKSRIGLLTLLLLWALSHASVFGGSGEPLLKEPSPAEKIRKVLDQPITLDYTGNSFHELMEHLKDKTKINFVLDRLALQQMGLAADDNPNNNGFPQPTLVLKCDRNGKLRNSIQRMLTGYNLTYAILEDSVLITTEENGLNRQLRQRVSVNVNNVALGTALKDLARTTALNLVIDPRVGKVAESKVSLQLDDATLETTVRLLAEMANLKSVRMGNVLFITGEANASKIRREDNQTDVPSLQLRSAIGYENP